MADASHRCRLCTANDVDALTEELAAALWERRRSAGSIDDRPWAAAGPYWHENFRQFTVEVVGTLREK